MKIQLLTKLLDLCDLAAINGYCTYGVKGFSDREKRK